MLKSINTSFSIFIIYFKNQQKPRPRLNALKQKKKKLFAFSNGQKINKISHLF